MSSYNLFSATMERSSTLQVSVAIAAIAFLSSAFLFPPKNGWTGLLLNGLSLERIRDKSSAIFHLYFWGSSQNIVYTPTLIRTFAQLRVSVVDYTSIKWMIFNRTFGVPAEYRDTYAAASDELDACVATHLLQEPYMSDLSRSAISHIQAHLRSLATLDETLKGKENDGEDSDPKSHLERWEQHASVKRTENSNPSVEVSLFPLLTSFLGHMTLPAMMGKAYVANSPDALEDIDSLDDSFLGLTAKLPRWLPPLRKAYEARDRLHQGLASFYHALDMEAEGQLSTSYKDLSDVSELIRSYDRIWKRIGFSVHARAAAGLSMPWALTINANNLVFWLLLRILATPGLANEVRNETKTFFQTDTAQDDTPQGDLVEMSRKGDMGRFCPLLKACYFETLRLDGEIRSSRKIRRDMLVPKYEAVSNSAFNLKSGDYLHAFHYLHHSDPKYFEEPEIFKPERFLVREGSSVEVNQRTLRPYGAGFSMCKGRVIAERICLHLVAGILHTWEVEPTDAGWKVPDHISAAGFCKPNKDVRVNMSRRI